jgi:hypothetical protein
MGVFDYVRYEANCPHCGKRLTEFQTKDGDPYMNTVEPKDVWGWLKRIRPAFVNIGADSKGHQLPEPPKEKILALVDLLNQEGIEIREKKNLKTLLTGDNGT